MKKITFQWLIYLVSGYLRYSNYKNLWQNGNYMLNSLSFDLLSSFGHASVNVRRLILLTSVYSNKKKVNKKSQRRFMILKKEDAITKIKNK